MTYFQFYIISHLLEIGNKCQREEADYSIKRTFFCCKLMLLLKWNNIRKKKKRSIYITKLDI